MKVVYFRGRPTCTCVPKWIDQFEKELIRRGWRPKGFKLTIYQLQGLYEKSGGTHSAGGAIDCAPLSARELKLARAMGGVASMRTEDQGFTPHWHVILNGCPHNGPARYQVSAIVIRGNNGLGYNGDGGRDRDPRPRKGDWRTWDKGIRWSKSKETILYQVVHTDVPVYKGPGKNYGTVKLRNGNTKYLRVGQKFRTRGRVTATRTTKWHHGIKGGVVPNRRKRGRSNFKRVG